MAASSTGSVCHVEGPRAPRIGKALADTGAVYDVYMGRGQATYARDQFSMIFGDRRGLRAGQEVELFAPRQEGKLDFAIFSPGAEQVERLLRVLRWWGPGSQVEFSATTLVSDVPVYQEISDPEESARADIERLVDVGICKKVTTFMLFDTETRRMHTPYALRKLEEWPEEHRLVFTAWVASN